MLKKRPTSFTEPPLYPAGFALSETIHLSKASEWCDYWRPGEGMWKGMIPKHAIGFSPDHETIHDVSTYFADKRYLDKVPADYEWDRSSSAEAYGLENFTKLVWLSSEFLTTGWQDILSMHWNPRKGLISIHPGGCRQQVIRIFDENDSVEAHFFNTGGFYTEWMQDLTLITDPYYFDKLGWHSAVTPDHGTFIPHFLNARNVHTLIPAGKAKWHKILSQKLQDPNFRVHSTCDLSIPEFEPWLTSNIAEASVCIRGMGELDQIDSIAVIILALTGITHKYKNVKVLCKN